MSEAQTEAATPRKRARARRRGDIPRSRDLPAAVALLSLAAALWWLGAEGLAELRELLLRGLRAAAEERPAPGAILGAAVGTASALLVAPLAAAFAGALLAGLLQVGPLFSPTAVLPGRERARPALWSGGRAEAALWTLLKLLVLFSAAWLVLQGSLRGLFALAFSGPAATLTALARLLGGLALWLGASWFLVGLADLLIQHVRHRLRLRMSRRELREELREVYGDPAVRARRRAALLEARLRVGLRELASAGLLLLDGKGRAVALGRSAADGPDAPPRVWLKGQGELASRIAERAEQLGLPAAHDDALVAQLYPLELTERVPPSLYAQVAAHWVG